MAIQNINNLDTWVNEDLIPEMSTGDYFKNAMKTAAKTAISQVPVVGPAMEVGKIVARHFHVTPISAAQLPQNQSEAIRTAVNKSAIEGRVEPGFARLQ